jgi:hypothetical protein
MNTRSLPPSRKAIPHIQSNAPFVIYSPSAGVIGAYVSKDDAVSAFTDYAKEAFRNNEQGTLAIYRRTPKAWLKV